jgi:hypothetical protein
MRSSSGATRALPKFVVTAIGVALLGFAVHDIVSLGMGLSSIASARQFWDALGDLVTWAIAYRVGVAVAFWVCVAMLYVSGVLPMKNK